MEFGSIPTRETRVWGVSHLPEERVTMSIGPVLTTTTRTSQARITGDRAGVTAKPTMGGDVAAFRKIDKGGEPFAPPGSLADTLVLGSLGVVMTGANIVLAIMVGDMSALIFAAFALVGVGLTSLVAWRFLAGKGH